MSPKSSSRKKQSLFIRIVGPIVIIALVVYMVFANAMEMTKTRIENNLKSLAESVEKQAADNGKEGKLSYGDVSFEGFGFDKRAVIHNVSLSLAEKAITDTPKWVLSTASVVVKPDAFLDEKLTFIFPEPINIIQNSELKSLITFPEAPKFSYFDGVRKNVKSIEQALFLPEKVTITPSKSVDDTATTKTGAIEITYDKAPIISSTFLPETHEKAYTLDIKNFKLSGEEGPRLVATTISTQYNEKQVDENTLEGQYVIRLVDLLPLGSDSMNKPYTLNGDFGIKSKTPESAPAAAGGNFADITVNALSLINSEFQVHVEGKASAASDDPLLFGEGTLKLDNAGNFVSSDLIPQQAKGAVSMALQKLLAQPIEPTTQAEIALKREKSGVFYINAMPFEELANSLFSDLTQNAQPGEVPPAAQDDSAVPTTLPDSPPAASAGAAPYSPVLSAPVAAPAKPSAAEEFQKAPPAPAGDKQ